MKKSTLDKPVLLTLLGFLLVWLTSAIAGGIAGIFDQPGKPPLFFGLFLAAPTLAILLTYWFSQRMRRALAEVPLWWVTSIHIVRLVGIAFVVYVVLRIFPAEFGLSAGFGDIISALVAIPLTIALFRGHRSRSLYWRFIAWNIFGLTDLVTAITVGLLYSDSSIALLRHGGLSTAALADLPINLIPTFYVPVLILLHLLAFRRSKEVLR